MRLENAAPLWHLFNKLLFGGSNYYVWHVFWRMMMTPPTTLLACGGLTTKPVVVKNVVPFKKSLLKQLFITRVETPNRDRNDGPEILFWLQPSGWSRNRTLDKHLIFTWIKFRIFRNSWAPLKIANPSKKKVGQFALIRPHIVAMTLCCPKLPIYTLNCLSPLGRKCKFFL